MECILADRLYVPESCVSPDDLSEFVYTVEEQSGYDFGPFSVTTGSIRTFAKANIGGQIYYAFSRGNIEKLGRLFGDLPWNDQTSKPAMAVDLQFKGQLHTWESKQIGQQEAVNEWLRSKQGVIRASPRFGKCCLGDTIIHTVEYGSIQIKELFASDHIDGDYVSRNIKLATKEGVYSTSFLYKKIVDRTLKITTKNGLSIEATPNHPLFIKDKHHNFDWKKMEDIKLGDKLAIQINSQIFTNKQSSYLALFAKYVLKNRKFSEQIILRILKLRKIDQKMFLDYLIINDEINIDNKKVLSLLQIMLLNLGFNSRLEI